MEVIVILGVTLDIIMGDPRWMPHPVIFMGHIISLSEQIIRNNVRSDLALKYAGAILTLLMVIGSYCFFAVLIWLAYKINYIFGLSVSVLLLSQSLAANSLFKHARAVVIPLSAGNLGAARSALAMIVGRDTDELSEKEIIRGAVETVAENTVDGITAPLFYALLGGPPLALAYKAVNTLDSMIGYKDERYLNLGWAAARLDDLANYIPARITGLLFLSIAVFTRGGIKSVWTTIKQDAWKHPSPNSGIPEAAVAGALQVQLGGVNYYRGLASPRALIGETKNQLAIADINTSLGLMAAVSAEMLILGITILRLVSG